MIYEKVVDLYLDFSYFFGVLWVFWGLDGACGGWGWGWGCWDFMGGILRKSYFKTQWLHKI